MPLKPTHAAKSFVANRVFTDREDAKELFDKACDDPQATDEYRALMWYGVGGQGKSALGRELSRRFRRKREAAANMPSSHKLALAQVDFDDPNFRRIDAALLSLRLQLSAGAGVRFPAFDTAFARYFALTNPGVKMRERHPELFRSGENELLDDLLDWSEEGIGELISDAAKATADVVLPGLNVIYKYGSRWTGRLRDWWDQRGKRVLQELDDLRPDELLERLPSYFGADIADALKTNPALRLVVLFDTYEALWRERGQKDGSAASRTDRWVRLLVQDSPGVLFVIFGRDKLRWVEENEAWAKVIDDHLLGTLSDADADAFLRQVPIEDTAIRARIVDGAKGLPFYLDLQVDLYAAIIDNGKTPESGRFGGSHGEILKRFLDHLSDHEESLLRLASYPLTLNETLLNELASKFLGGSAHANWGKFRERSFVMGSGDGAVLMHTLMRDALQAREKEERPSLFEDVHRWLFEEYDVQCQPDDVRFVTLDHEAALRNTAYHRQAFDEPSFPEWADERLKVFDDAARWKATEPIIRQVLEIRLRALGEEHQDMARNYTHLAVNLKAQGRLREAELLLKKALEICRRALGEEHPDTATSYNNLAMNLKAQGRFGEANPLYSKAFDIFQRELGEKHPDTVTNCSNLAMNLMAQGRLQEAESLLEKALEIRRQLLGEEHRDTATSYNNLATNLMTQGRLRKAEPFLRKAFEIRRRVLGEEHPDTVICYGNIAQNLTALGRYGEAELILKEILDTLARALGEEHRDTATSYNNLAHNLRSQGRLQEAESLYKKALEIRVQVLGEEHPDTAQSYNNLAANLGAQWRLQEAESLHKKALEIRLKVLGEEHPDTAQSYSNVAHNLQAQGHLKEAELLARKALEIRKRALGEEHPDTATSYNNLAGNFLEQGRLQEAEPLFEKALKISRRMLGKQHPQTRGIRSNLKALLAKKGRG